MTTYPPKTACCKHEQSARAQNPNVALPARATGVLNPLKPAVIMMRSSMNNGGGGSDDDDDFAPNPFRSDTTDFFSAPSPTPPPHDPFAQPPPQQQQQQQQFQQQQLQPQQQFQQQHQQQPVYGQQQHQQQQPVSNFPPPHQQQQIDPSSLTGTMDQSKNTNYGANNNNAQELPPPSMFSWRGITSCCKLESVQQLFDVDSVDIYLRLKGALTQFHHPNVFRTSIVGDTTTDVSNGANDDMVRKGPDLYGPFWVSMTLMFVLGMTSNLSDYMHHSRKKSSSSETEIEMFEYDINHLNKAMYISFTCSFLLPTIFWLVCHLLGMPNIAWSMWVCVYGYSMVPLVAGALVAWWLPYEIWHWLVLAASVGASGLLVVRNLSAPLLSQDQSSGGGKVAPVLLAILGAHVGILLVLKISFYP